MAYWDLSLLANDADFSQRTVAAASEQLIPDPEPWASTHRWEMAAAPGFADAYASALAGGVPDPGRDPAVISDDMIRAQVQFLNPGAAPA